MFGDNHNIEGTRRPEGIEYYASVVSPSAAIYESDSQIDLEVEMPGLAKEDVRAHISKEALIVSGKKESAAPLKDHRLLYSERIPCEYRREFFLSPDIDRGKIKATYQNGVLSITLFKQKNPDPRPIVIE